MAVSRINEAGLNVNQYGNRNVIINGGMKVAQRATSETGIGASSGYFTVDRYKIQMGGTATAGRLTMTQESDGPSGFANCVKLACTTADTSIAAGEYLIFRQIIEGQNLQQFAKGTSDAKEFSVSFYVKGNASATYTCELFDGDNARQISKTFSVTTSWTRVILTFPADTTGAFADDNGVSLYLQLFLHAGSTYTSGTLNSTSWASNTNANRVSSSNTSFFDSTSRTFFITGVQIEVGDTATDFEHRTFGDELVRCQRYYQKIGGIEAGNVGDGGIGAVAVWSTTAVYGALFFPTKMRAAPTLGHNGDLNDFTLFSTGSTFTPLSTLASTGRMSDRVEFNATVASGLTAGNSAWIRINDATNGYIDFDAEL